MKFSRFALFLAGVMMMGMIVTLGTHTPQSQAAFGTSPPWVRNDHLLPGTTYEQIINLSRNEADMDMKVTVRIEGDKEITKWLQIENQKNLVMKKGQTSLPMKVTVKVPSKAALKNYRGGIFVTLESITDGSQQGGNVAIKLGAHILVELSVIGDKVTDYRIKSISLDTLDKGQPFHLNIEIENLGNTEITDINGQIDIYDRKETGIIKSLTFGKLTLPISPDEITRTSVVLNDLILDPGEYWIVAKIFKNDKVIYENRLYQKVNEEVVPQESATVKKPGIPKQEKEAVATSEEEVVTPAATESPVLHEAAAPEGKNNDLIVLFGLAGLGFGLITMLSVIILLVTIIRNQRQTMVQNYLSSQKKL
jgi:hypothetical protein